MAYEYHYHNTGGSGGNGDLISWLIVVVALVAAWPLGLFLLWRKLAGGQWYNFAQRSQHPYDIRRQGGNQVEHQRPAGQNPGQTSGQASAPQGGAGSRRQTEYRYQPERGGPSAAPGMQGVPRQAHPVEPNRGRAMTVWGTILTSIFGLAAITAIPAMLADGGIWFALTSGAPIMGLLSLGVGLLIGGRQRNKKARRFRKYLALIGKRSSLSISSLAQAIPTTFQTAWNDLQDMLDEGYLPVGYLDMASGRLVLSDEGLQEDVPEPEPEPEEALSDDAFLLEIKQINDAIVDEDMSRKIDRIGEITAKILDYQRKSPSKAGQLHSFLGYYLPTTLKILRAYARLESQGIEGENIRSAKQRIEGMMDKVVEGFEKQLDKLFQDDAMDITTDVEVLERMLDKDGLNSEMRLEL